MSAQIGIIAAFALYLLVMLGIGVYFSNKSEDLSDYVLGGRGIGKWVTSLSAQASDMSGWLLMGLPGLAYASGFGEAFWLAVGLSAGTYLNWKLVAQRLRVYTQMANDSLTISDFFENRFEDNTHLLRIISSIFIVIFFTLYVSSGFIAGGKLFNTVFGIQYEYAILIGGGVLVFYTFLGGFFAVSWSDMIQGFVMLFAAIAVPAYALINMGGISAASERIAAISPTLFSITKDIAGNNLSAIAVISSLAWGLGYFGMPHILVRFMGIDSADNIKDARKIAMVWVIISLASAMFIGVIGRAYSGAAPLAGTDSEKIFMVMVQSLFVTFLAGIMLSAILAAIMSTADSQLLVAASSISEDFYKAIFKKEAGQKELVWAGRAAVIIISIVAYSISLNPNSSVFKVVSFAWAGLGATFGPIIIMALFWRRTTGKGALAGVLAGGITVLVWKNLSSLGGIFTLYEIVPAFILSMAAIIIVSLLDEEPSKEITDLFDKVQQEM
ncbi:MAG TPA: sodium/proline symporter PutP [Spirochaetota bacterium]|nr:sodium/proline symporter PutP [Spirochaetota bacterium]HPF05747.1 sodium/proline symporter PutP [Spirochaetota bacterium]HPJ42624.1 sodium/proline symporter PutP [Spirochaetota bacterium]HPR37261.1 sodium/proline symporter PutP [Spirochaetota bacterium]HRX49144.1 sodium/proline symporter PutP [Spirochaetota bacterium]